LLAEGGPEIVEVTIEGIGRWRVNGLGIDVAPLDLQVFCCGEGAIWRKLGGEFASKDVVLRGELPT
jgi:hypothetical protein